MSRLQNRPSGRGEHGGASAEGGKDLVMVGQVVAPWGTRGQVKIVSYTDFPERFSAGQTLLVGGQRRTVAESRPHKNAYVLRFDGVTDRDAASALRGVWIEVPEAELRVLPEGEYYHFQLIGLRVETEEGEILGEVAEVLETGSNDVLVVRGQKGETLLPAVDEVVLRVDLEARRLTVRLLEGMV